MTKEQAQARAFALAKRITDAITDAEHEDLVGIDTSTINVMPDEDHNCVRVFVGDSDDDIAVFYWKT